MEEASIDSEGITKTKARFSEHGGSEGTSHDCRDGGATELYSFLIVRRRGREHEALVLGVSCLVCW